MLSLNQKTINGIIKLNGIGLHNGVRADLTIKLMIILELNFVDLIWIARTTYQLTTKM